MDHLSSSSNGSSSMQSDDNALLPSATIDDVRATASGKASKLGISLRNSGRGSSGNGPSITSPRSPSKFLGVVVPKLSTPRSASFRDSVQLGRERGFNAITASSVKSSDGDPQPTTNRTRDRSAAPFAGDPLSLAESISSALTSAAGIPLPTEDVNDDEEILELISPEVAREYHTDVTAASAEPAESDDELLSIAYPRSDHLATHTAVNQTEETEAQSHAQNGMAFTGSIVDALTNAFMANDDESISPPSSSARPTRQGLFLEASSGSESDTQSTLFAFASSSRARTKSQSPCRSTTAIACCPCR
ncbi:hypothetical protein BDZ89DRAFT_705840 [Hymenopellis radicata]|nr:hypothetical protein BDZ89DRAFT_705840 [Hymenopellis radicata]